MQDPLRCPHAVLGETTPQRAGQPGPLAHPKIAGPKDGWAAPGAFATTVGVAFRPGASDSLFFVAKAVGPLIEAVGIQSDREQGGAAAVAWMLQWQNPSAFWRITDLLSPGRNCVAWSNVAKIDPKTAAVPGGLHPRAPG